MNKYFATMGLGLCGHNTEIVLFADTLKEAEELARDACIEFADMYGFFQDLEHFGDFDQVGKPWDDEEAEDQDSPYQEEGTLEYEVVLFDPELHGEF